MSNKIDGNSGAAQTYGPTMEEVEGDSQVEGPVAQQAQEAGGAEGEYDAYDAWDFEQQYADYMPKKEQAGPTMERANQAESESFSAWEAQSASAVADDAPRVEQDPANPILDEFSSSLESGGLTAEGLANGDYDYGTGLSRPLLDQLSQGELLTGLSDPAQLREELTAELRSAPGGAELSSDQVDAIVDDVIESCEARAVQTVQTTIKSRIDVSLRGSQAFMDGAADNAREIAAGIAEKTDDPATISRALQNLGVPEGEASDIADDLSVIAKDPDKLAAFKAGTEGDAEFFTLGDGWKDVEGDLAEAFRDSSEDVSNLRSRVSSDSYKNARILNSDLYEGPRSIALAEMKADLDPAQTEAFDRIIGEAKAEGDAADTREAVGKSVIAIGTAVATGGLGAAAGLGMGAAGSAEALNTAYGDVNIARTAEREGIASEADVRNAEAKFWIEAAFASLGAFSGARGARQDGLVNEAPEVIDFVQPGAETLAQEVGKAGTNAGIDAATDED